jgi:hypothetical protein
MKKQIALIAGLVLVSFLAGLIALYFAMPLLQPEKVEAVRAELDSLRALAADSLIAAAPIDVIVDLDLVLADSADTDSTGPAAIALDEHPRFIALADSLARVHALAETTEQDRSRLLKRIEELEAESMSRTAVSADMTELSGTLTRLEENELRPILERLDDATVARLYQEASGRNRTKILRSMNADRAARLVQRMAGRPLPPPTQAVSATTQSDTPQPEVNQP